MTDPESSPDVARPRRRRFQLGLRVLFWLIAAIAVWMTAFINRRENSRLSTRIESLRPLARDLVVDDPSKFAVVKLNELWSEDQRWDVHLPPGRYRVCLATRKVDDTGFPRSFQSSPIDPGRHRLSLDQEKVRTGTRILVNSDGTRVLSVEESKDWGGNGWASRGDLSASLQKPTDQPLVLHRRRIWQTDASGRSVTVSGPTVGILLWIERTDGPELPASN